MLPQVPGKMASNPKGETAHRDGYQLYDRSFEAVAGRAERYAIGIRAGGTLLNIVRKKTCISLPIKYVEALKVMIKYSSRQILERQRSRTICQQEIQK
jgi:hypothetical protein